MKKIFLMIILFLGCFKVSALENNIWTDQISSNDSSLMLNSEERYRWYKEEKVYSDEYYIEGQNDSSYPFIDYSDSTESDWSGWLDEKPIDLSGRTIDTSSVIRYHTIKPVRYLFLENFRDEYDGKFNIAELNVLIDGVEIYPEIICNDCSKNFINYINDGVLDDKTYINDGGEIMIDLGNYYDIYQIGLWFYLYSYKYSSMNFEMNFNAGNSLSDRNYAKRFINYQVSYDDYNNPEAYYLCADKAFSFNPEYGDWIYVDEYFSREYYEEIEVIDAYRYKDIKYRYYNIEKSYLDGYYKETPGELYIKDEDSAKTFYLYEIKDDNEVINNENEDTLDKKTDDLIIDMEKCINYVNDNEIIEDKDEDKEIILDKKCLKNSNALMTPQTISSKNDKETSDNIWTDDSDVKSLSIGIAVFESFAIVLYRIRKRILSHQK
jgi:hypothetical protein